MKSSGQLSSGEEDIISITGLVAFFDILGWKGLLLHNDCNKAAKLIQSALHENSRRIRTHLKKTMNLTGFKYIVVSDSIFIYQSRSSTEENLRDFARDFVSFCEVFTVQMFERGLPVRGAIARGDYCEVGGGPVGRPIVEAYELADSLDISGCALAMSAEGWLMDPDGPWDSDLQLESPFQGRFKLYPTPVRSGRKLNLYLMDYRKLLEKRLPVVRSEIWSKFQAHGKNLGAEVYSKVHNTIDFLDWCKPLP